MLRPRKKISKREIKEDALVTFYFRVQKFIRNYKKQVNIGLVVIVTVSVVGVLMVRSKKKAELTAAGRLGMAEQFYFAANYQKAIEELTPLVETYSGTKAAGTAVFYVANAYFALRDYPQAEKYYQIYVDDYSQNALISASSLAGIAACWESQQEYEKAAGQYEKAWRKYPDVFTAPYNLKDAGRCYALAGNREKAKQMYEHAMERYAESAVIQEVEFLSAAL